MVFRDSIIELLN